METWKGLRGDAIRLKQPDDEDAKELERLTKLVSGRKFNLPTEELKPREATALLRYIDSLEAKARSGTATQEREDDETVYDQSDLDMGLRKLVGIAATPPTNKAGENQSKK